jgi:hypothetical protein
LREESPDRLGKYMRFEFDLLPGASRYAPPRHLEALLPTPVADKRGIGVVEAAAVGFEDQPLVAPEEVGLQPAALHLEGDVYLWLRQAGLKANVEKHPLELASGVSGLGMDFIEEPAKAGYSAPTPSST